MFRFSLNTSSTAQSFFTKSMDPITVFPHQALDSSQIHGDVSGILEPIDSFMDYINKRKIKRFYVERSYAMGDILLLVPIIRELKRQGYDVCVRTTRAWFPVLDLLDIEMQMKEQNPYSTDWGINLDGILEQDHSVRMFSEMHRCDIYAKALGMDRIKKLDWSIDSKKLPDLFGKSSYIVFQHKGSTAKKHLPISTGRWIVNAIEKNIAPVIQIGDEKRLTIKELFATIAQASCLICMDSSPLWISHFTQTPIISLLGPTRESERLTRHPLYPKKAIGIQLNKEINCPSCFEQTRKCNSRVDCLRIEPERIWNLIHPHIEKFWR